MRGIKENKNNAECTQCHKKNITKFQVNLSEYISDYVEKELPLICGECAEKNFHKSMSEVLIEDLKNLKI